MTKKDFFRILIKLLVLSAFIQNFFGLLTNIANIFSSSSEFSFGGSLLYPIIINVLIGGFFLWLLRLVILKPDFIINFFKLDKNFDDDNIVLGNLNSEKLLNLGLFTVGIYFVVTSLSSLISKLFLLSGDSSMMNNPYFKDIWSKQELVISIVNMLVGLVLISYRKNITTYFEK
ncbi:hypothetical protein [Soonwooa sp.]|uniref:hypothetical protein n=1 Tax=Soonwooa sp. TaxID=1938592 RepID=UPI0026193190|nr:hypothetical protein [Soonwooa sp.]